jgi:hypothetical protein
MPNKKSVECRCQWTGCDVTFLAGNGKAKWCPEHRPLAIRDMYRKKAREYYLNACKKVRVCEITNCENPFTGSPTRHFCDDHHYGRRSQPAAITVKMALSRTTPTAALKNLGKMPTDKMLKLMQKWTAGKVDFV